MYLISAVNFVLPVSYKPNADFGGDIRKKLLTGVQFDCTRVL